MNQQTEIVRVLKSKNFTVIDNRYLRRNDLSWKAKGILTYILSLPDDWVINLGEIEKHSTEGKTAFRSGWNELKNKGYVERYAVKDKETKKITHWETIVRENVDLMPSEPLTENPPNGKPLNGNPSNGKPSNGNEKLLNTNNTNYLNKPNTENTKVSSPVKHQYGEFQNVLLTDDEHAKLLERFPNDLDKRIERLSDYVASTGKKYKSHYATIISWAKKDTANNKRTEYDPNAIIDKELGF